MESYSLVSALPVLLTASGGKFRAVASMSRTLLQHSIISPSPTQEEWAASSQTLADDEIQLGFDDLVVSSMYLLLQ